MTKRGFFGHPIDGYPPTSPNFDGHILKQVCQLGLVGIRGWLGGPGGGGGWRTGLLSHHSASGAGSLLGLATVCTME